MKFTSDRQRKAIFANMNKFAADPGFVKGYTGSRIYPDPYQESKPFVTVNGVPVKIDETAILAGQGYKSMPTRDDVVAKRNEELLRGMPVYSSTPPLSDVEYRKLQETWALMDAEKNLAKIKQAQDIERGAISPPPVVASGDNFVMYSAPAQKELIPGGLSSGRPDSDFDQEQIAMGVEVEKEHVIRFTDKGNVKKFKETDLAKAKEIAKDHLAEIPDYYTRLDQLEECAKEEGKFIDVIEQKKDNPGEFSRASEELKSDGRFTGIRNNMEIWVKDGKEFGITPGQKVIDLSYLH